MNGREDLSARDGGAKHDAGGVEIPDLAGVENVGAAVEELLQRLTVDSVALTARIPYWRAIPSGMKSDGLRVVRRNVGHADAKVPGDPLVNLSSDSRQARTTRGQTSRMSAISG